MVYHQLQKYPTHSALKDIVLIIIGTGDLDCKTAALKNCYHYHLIPGKRLRKIFLSHLDGYIKYVYQNTGW